MRQLLINIFHYEKKTLFAAPKKHSSRSAIQFSSLTNKTLCVKPRKNNSNRERRVCKAKADLRCKLELWNYPKNYETKHQRKVLAVYLKFREKSESINTFFLLSASCGLSWCNSVRWLGDELMKFDGQGRELLARIREDESKQLLMNIEEGNLMNRINFRV